MPSGLRAIRLADGRYVLKRGIHELVIGGEHAAEIAEGLVSALSGAESRAGALDAFPGHLRGDVQKLLGTLVARGMVADPDGSEPWSDPPADDRQQSFYANFGAKGRAAPRRLREARVFVFGTNPVANELCRRLIDCGVGDVAHVPVERLDDADGTPGLAGTTGYTRLDAAPDEGALERANLICAVSDAGRLDALLDLGRLALAHWRPFLPVWMEDLVGSVGPLCHPYETACLRCYALRSDSNDPRMEVTRALRGTTSSAGYLPPMAGALAELAAMEVVKAIGEFVPADAVGRIIQLNLISHSSRVRRVLKVPRCPDCSEKSLRATPAILRGPQIAQ